MMGTFCNTSFLTTTWCPKNFQWIYFHPPLLTWKYFENSWKNNFFEILVFFQILLIFTYICLTKSCTKKWLKQRLNRSVFKWIGSSKDDKVWKDYEKCFLESYLSYNLEEPIHLNIFLFNHCFASAHHCPDFQCFLKVLLYFYLKTKLKKIFLWFFFQWKLRFHTFQIWSGGDHGGTWGSGILVSVKDVKVKNFGKSKVSK